MFIWKWLTALAGAFLAAVSTVIILSSGYILLQLRDYGGMAAVVDGLATIVDGLLFIAGTAALVSAIMVFLAIVFLAVPLIVISHALGCTSRSYYALSGSVIGLVTIAMAEIWRRWSVPLPPFQVGQDETFFVIAAITAGALAGLTCWAIARPDRQLH